MNNKLYNDLVEYCNYDYNEVENTIEYFKNRLYNETKYNCKSNLENAMIDEIDMILACNFDDFETGLSLMEESKLDIARDVIDNEDNIWEELNIVLIKKIKHKLEDRLKYLKDKEKVCSLDKEERIELEILIENIEKGEY